jgi:hypothetical protein
VESLVDNTTANPDAGAGNDKTILPLAESPAKTAGGSTVIDTNVLAGIVGVPITLVGTVGAVTSMTGSRELQPAMISAAIATNERRSVDTLRLSPSSSILSLTERYIVCNCV